VVEVLQIAVFGVNSQVIGDIVAKIFIGRWVNRRQPNGINTEILDIVKRINDASKVANTIGVRIFE